MSEQNQNNKEGKATEKKDQDQSGNDNAGHMIPKARFDQVVNQRNELVSTLKGLADEIKAEVPEEFQDLIPSKLAPQDQIQWVRNAQKKNLFDSSQTASGPDSKRAGNILPINYNSMNPIELIKMGLNKTR